MKRAASLGILLVAFVSVGGARRAQEAAESRPFALPDDRDARALADQALEHLREERWSEALAALERLIDVHGGSILPAPYRDARDLPSAHPNHPGAASWARSRLRELDREPLELWHERHEREAEIAWEAARRRADRRALVEIPRRYSLSTRSIQALVALGDLELEQGNLGEALVAWERARTLRSPEASPLEARLALARRLLGERFPAGVSPLFQRSGTPGESDADHPRCVLPRRDVTPWFAPLDLAPFEPRSDYYHSLFPVLAGDKLLVSSSLRLFCLDAFTGRLLWQAGPHAGWSELDERLRGPLFLGINRQQILIAPAVQGRIALAALQLPYSVEPNEAWQGIEIQKPIPQRRLFAYDLDTGRELWNHAPKLVWKSRTFEKEASSSYAQEMLVAAPPVIAGARVLVPCYRLQGRIDFHVACYELETGALLWSTAVVSGQRPTNMFGRPSVEFTSSPVVVSAGRVVVQTELGTVAALDLFSGEILWESLYRQLPLPKTRSYAPQERKLVWRLAPPVVVGNVVISTPSDSDEIAAFRLEDGRVIWTYSENYLASLDGERSHEYNRLVGADAHAVILGGDKLCALRKAGGIGSTSPFETAWPVRLLESDSDSRGASKRLPWPVVCGDTIFAPLRGERIVLDRSSGIERRSHGGTWETRASGNPLIANGFLFTLGREGLSGFVDWETLLELPRARLAEVPRDDAATLELARLYVRRSEVVSANGETPLALSGLRSARELLEPLRARKLAETQRDERFLARTNEELFRVLTRQAALFEAEENRVGAVENLALARPLAPSPEALRDTLLSEERILWGWRRTEEHRAVLSELEERCGSLELPRSLTRWAELGLPELAATAADQVSVGLWVLFARAAANEQAGHLIEAFEDWHAVLARHDVVPLGNSTAGEEARARIAAELEHPEGRTAYVGFEARAAELYGRALEASDSQLLSDVSRLYPHSRAALDADRARLEAAYADEDPAAVAAVFYSTPATLKRPEDFERSTLLLLADLLGRSGNVEFECALVSDLIRRDPEAISDLETHGGRRLSEILEERRSRLDEGPPLPARFDSRVVPTEGHEGRYRFLGRLLRSTDPEEGPEEIHVYLVSHPRLGDALEAFSSSSGARPAWRVTLAEPVVGPEACGVSQDRIVLGDRTGVFALDLSGNAAWSRRTASAVQWLSTQDGIVLACVGNSAPERILAFEAHGGIALWNLALDTAVPWRAPVGRDGRAVLFSLVHAQPPRAALIDVFRGRFSADFRLDGTTNERLEENAWIAEERLLVPHFASSPQGVTAYELGTGRKLWTRPLPEEELLHSIVELAGKDYCITLSQSTSSNGAIYALEPAPGTLRRVATLLAGERPLGIPENKRSELEGTSLFTLVQGISDRVPIRVFELPHRVREYALRVAPADLFLDGNLPFPAVSEECIALVVLTRDRNGLRGEPMIVFFERSSRERNHEYPVDTGFLGPDLGSAQRIELRGLGEALFAIGVGSNARGLRLEILEKMR